MHPTIPNFLFNLQSDGRSPKSMETYEGLIQQFIRWFEDTTGERFDPESVTPIDAKPAKESPWKSVQPVKQGRRAPGAWTEKNSGRFSARCRKKKTA